MEIIPKGVFLGYEEDKLNYFKYIEKVVVLLSVIFLFGLTPATAQDLAFQWEPDHPSDMVVKYRIYWSPIVGNYHPADMEEIAIENLSDPQNPEWTLNTAVPIHYETLYFVCTAVDMYGYESDFSNAAIRNYDLNDQPPSADAGPDQSIE